MHVDEWIHDLKQFIKVTENEHEIECVFFQVTELVITVALLGVYMCNT